MSQKSLFVIPECYIDTALVEYVLDMRVNHQHSCNNVVRTIKERYGDGFAVGIIDNDKHGMGYLGECSLVAKSNHLEVFKHQNRSHFIITVTPAMDGFVMECAKEQGVNLSDIGLPTDLKSFKHVTKSERMPFDKRFPRLFQAIKDNEEIVALRNTLGYLCREQYNANLTTILLFFQSASN